VAQGVVDAYKNMGDAKCSLLFTVLMQIAKELIDNSGMPMN
jgi:hypothetical protein